MTIDMNPQTRALATLSPDASLQALMIDLDDSAADAERIDHEATRERFDSAEDALDDAARNARLAMWSGVLDGAAGLAKGVTDAVASLRAPAASNEPSSDGESPATDTPPPEARPLGETIALSSVDDVLSIGSTVLGGAATRAKNDQQRAELLSERAKDRSDEASERASRDRSARDALLRQLDELARERHAAQDRALAALAR